MAMRPLLEIKDLHVSVEGKEILKGVTLSLAKGEVVAVMGPNGSGKSTFANAVMGNPKYEVTGGTIALDGESIAALGPDERARRGLFLSFQYPSEIPGVTMFNFLRTALNAQRAGRGEPPLRVYDFTKLLKEKMSLLKVDEKFSERYLNDGFSGGEKKRAEILQLALFSPRIAILDETDSGLDIDALRVVAEGINATKTPETTYLLITHYQRILDYVKPDRILIMKGGRIVKEGGPELAHHLEKEGYDAVGE
jgi:Fe-S cluster assembly ATP-binding protein